MPDCKAFPICAETRKGSVRSLPYSFGDETASALAAEYGDGWQVFDMGFPGDKVQNAMWRVIQGTLAGYDPALIVISVGGHNEGVNTPAEIAAAKAKLLGLVRERAAGVEVQCKGKW